MDDATTQVKRALASVDTVSREIATFVSTDGIRGVVDFGGGRIPADMSWYRPAINEPVWIIRINGTALILGPTVMRPAEGTILTAPANNLVAVGTEAGQFSMTYATNLTLSSGLLVSIAWGGELGHVQSIKSTTPAPAPPPPAPGGGAGSGTELFSATESGSYRSSGNGAWWTDQVWASDTNLGIWAYGSKIPDTIPAAATIRSVEIFIAPQQIQGGPPVFAVHGYGSVTGAPAPSFAGGWPVAVSPGWVALPNAVGEALRAGSGYYGVGVNHGGYSIFQSVGAEPQSGMLRISWS